MALFDFFRKLSFFKGRDTSDLQDEDLDFQKWIAAHRDWRRRLASYIDGTGEETLDENVICVDNRCELGKWIHGHGGKFYGELGNFQQMVQDHASFHQAAGQVVRFYKQDGAQAARKALNTDFDRYSLRVVSALESLEKQVRE